MYFLTTFTQSHPRHPPHHWHQQISFSFSESLFFSIPHISEIRQYTCLSLYDLLPSKMPSRFICIVANGKISFIFMAEWYMHFWKRFSSSILLKWLLYPDKCCMWRYILLSYKGTEQYVPWHCGFLRSKVRKQHQRWTQ